MAGKSRCWPGRWRQCSVPTPRRCEVLGLGLGDLRFGERRLFITEGRGGHQRLIPVSPRFFTEVSTYPDAEHPAGAARDLVFTVLKGPRRGLPLTAAGLDEILDGGRQGS